MRKLRSQLGATLIEATVALAISGMIIGPLIAIFSEQLRLPGRISREANTERETLKSVQALTEDAGNAQVYTPGGEPEYGTFKWLEFSDDPPVLVTVRYYFDSKETAVFRETDRRGAGVFTQQILDSVAKYQDVTFQYTAPAWTYDAATEDWSFAEGQIQVAFTQTRESEKEGPPISTSDTVVVGLRPQPVRPSTQPLPSVIQGVSQRH